MKLRVILQINNYNLLIVNTRNYMSPDAHMNNMGASDPNYGDRIENINNMRR